MADTHELETGGARFPYIAMLLADARERQGLDLREAAESLRIRHAYLLAIESGRSDDLPGPTYALGFIRAYADYLGLDADEVVRRFKDEASGLDRQPELVFPAPLPEGRFPGRTVLAVSVIVAAAIYGGWYYMSSEDRSVVDLVPEVPERLTAKLSPDRVGGGSTDPATATAAPQEAQAAASETSVLGDGSQGGDISSGQASAVPEQIAAADLPAGDTAPAIDVSEVDEGAADRPASEQAGTATRSAPVGFGTTSDSVGDGAASETAEADTQRVSEPESGPSNVEASGDPTTTEPAGEPMQQVSELVTPAMEETESATEHIDVAAEPSSTESTIEQSSAPGTVTEVSLAEVPESTVRPPEPTEQLSTGEPAQGSESEGDPVETSAEVAETTGASGTGATSVPGAATPPAEALPPPPAAPEQLATARISEPRVYGAQNEGARIVVHARLDSWVQVRDRNSNLLLTRILRGGDSYLVPDEQGLTLLTGNAGALDIIVDGQPVPPIGPLGAVRRNVALDAELLLTGEAVND